MDFTSTAGIDAGDTISFDLSTVDADGTTSTPFTVTFTVAALTSALYSWVHFFERPPRPESVDAFTGIITLGQMLRGFTDVQSLIPGWLSLVLAGWMLALARERTGSLAFSIGLHAGWIFWLKASPTNFYTALCTPCNMRKVKSVTRS
jgi:membrane protease YdiL (CAAX protease family)